MVDEVVKFLELLKAEADKSKAGKATVRYFMEDGSEFSITYKAPNPCKGGGHRN